MDDLLVDFIAETRETLETLTSEIVAWETAPSDHMRLDAIFRFVHTVKGSCGFLNLPRLEKLSHAAEDVLADCRAERRQPDEALVSAVLAIIDRIAELANALETGESIPDHDDASLIAALAPGANKAKAEPEADTAATVVQAAGPRGMLRSIRLPVDLLDRMMAGVSDMVLARNDLSRRLRDTSADPAIDSAFERLSLCIAEMRDSITRTRMARIENLFSALPRMVRDLSAELGKQVILEIDGGDVELDREMIEMIRDPLTHIVRNAIDHGIEMPDVRIAAGKPAAGRLRVSARQAGNQIAIEAVDDGRGIDADRLVEKAIANGILTAEKAATMSWNNKLHLIFAAGLSTAKEVTSISGRGVGMDVVRTNVERIGGLVDVDSKPGLGLRLSMKVPLTLTIIPALTVSAGNVQFAIPRSAIEELIRVSSASARLCEIGGAKMVNIRGRRLPVVMLAPFLKLNPTCEEHELTMVVLKPAGGDHYALAVEAVHDHEELVVRPAAPALMATGIYAGTTLPDNSHPMLLLDPAGIAEAAGVLGTNAAAEEIEHIADVVDERVPTLLFRDLDGVERAIGLALVERIEEVRASLASFSAGRMRLSQDGCIIPLMSCRSLPETESYRVLRMTDGDSHIAYAISEVIDIVTMDFTCERATEAGLIAGVALVDGRPVELLDGFWLFAEAQREGGTAPESEPVCLLAGGDDPWARQVLMPLLRAGGYRVVFPGAENADNADIVVLCEEGLPSEITEGLSQAPVVRLTARPDPTETDLVYRYDRTRLLDALRVGTQRRRKHG